MFPEASTIIAACRVAVSKGLTIQRRGWGSRDCVCPLNALLLRRRLAIVADGEAGDRTARVAHRLRIPHDAVVAFTETFDAGAPCAEWQWERRVVRDARAAALEVAEAFAREGWDARRG